MKSALAGLLALLLASAGCGEPADLTCFNWEGETICVEDPNPGLCDVDPLAYGISTSPSGPHRAWNNGVNLNGVRLNGRAINGISMNGRAINGISMNGRAINGVNMNGRAINGRAMNSALQNGMNLGNGVELNALTSNAITTNAITTNAITTNALNAYLGKPNGETIRGTTLVGVALPSGGRARELQPGAHLLGVTNADEVLLLTLTGIAADPDDDARQVYQVALTGGSNLCGEDGAGLLVPGVWDARGARHDSVTVDGRRFDHSFSCLDGVIAKCVRWGYDPGLVGAELHASCTRMARADYCGDGIPHTENGTLIDIGDGAGVQSLTGDPAFVFEAGWSAAGAVCVHKPRYYDLDRDGQALPPSCWSALPRCADAAEASAHGALTFNASRPAVRHRCD